MMAKPPGALTPAAAAAHWRLSAALAELTAPLPCQRRGDALSDDQELRELAALACPACPILDACRHAGEHERFGVWGGIDRDQRTPPSRPGRND